MDISGVALVTGAGSGIGKACALAYAVEGASGVIFADLNDIAAQSALEESKAIATNPEYKAIAVKVDVTDGESVDAMMSAAAEAFGRIDYAVNCAGIGVTRPAPFADIPPSDFDQFMKINVGGTFLPVRAQILAMRKQELKLVNAKNPKRGAIRGSIINMGSLASYFASPYVGHYTTAKHAVLGLTKNAALEHAKEGIRVNCVCPSWVDTPMIQAAVAGNPGLQTFMDNAVPMGRIAQADEIADVVLFLSSPRSSYVVGAGYIVDGGAALCST